eukprot:369025-Pyramimonas_sp.AAC.1
MPSSEGSKNIIGGDVLGPVLCSRFDDLVRKLNVAVDSLEKDRKNMSDALLCFHGRSTGPHPRPPDICASALL